MILIVCLDNNNAMAFNRRRQSQDRAARERILALTAGAPLWMNGYSAKLFGDVPGIHVDEDFLDQAGPGAGRHCGGDGGAPCFRHRRPQG